MSQRDDDDRGRRGDDRGGEGRSPGRSGFQYKDRGASAWAKRANQKSGLYDRFLVEESQNFVMKEGDYSLRLMPPGWDNAEHCGYEIFLHNDIGSDHNSYLCLKEMKQTTCPICEERLRAEKAGEEDYARSLKPSKRVLIYVIDRDERRPEPRIWSMPYSVDKEIGKLVQDKETGRALPIDHHEEGYDIEISRTGKGLNTKYGGLKIARSSSPLSDDTDEMNDWLEYIKKNNIPTMLVFYDYEHIARVFAGAGGAEAFERKRARDDDRSESRGSDARGRSRSLHEESESDTRTVRDTRGRDSERDDRRGLGADEEPRARRTRDAEPEAQEERRPPRQRMEEPDVDEKERDGKSREPAPREERERGRSSDSDNRVANMRARYGNRKAE